MTAAVAHSQQDFSQVELTATHVAGAVYMLQGEGGNIGVSAGPDGLLIIDLLVPHLSGMVGLKLAPAFLLAAP